MTVSSISSMDARCHTSIVVGRRPDITPNSAIVFGAPLHLSRPPLGGYSATGGWHQGARRSRCRRFGLRGSSCSQRVHGFDAGHGWLPRSMCRRVGITRHTTGRDHSDRRVERCRDLSCDASFEHRPAAPRQIGQVSQRWSSAWRRRCWPFGASVCCSPERRSDGLHFEPPNHL